jgi:hypothetical protein
MRGGFPHLCDDLHGIECRGGETHGNCYGQHHTESGSRTFAYVALLRQAIIHRSHVPAFLSTRCETSHGASDGSMSRICVERRGVGRGDQPQLNLKGRQPLPALQVES